MPKSWVKIHIPNSSEVIVHVSDDEHGIEFDLGTYPDVAKARQAIKDWRGAPEKDRPQQSPPGPGA